jgi:protein-tyrosine phosphatase
MVSVNTIARYIKDPRRLIADFSSRLGIGSRKIRRALSGQIRSVLFVCQGNVCRSPLAAAYFDSRLREQNCPIEVRSAGLDTTPGKEAHPLATAVARQNNLSLQTHITTSLSRELVDRADLILVMELVHSSALLQKHPEAARKVVELGYFNQGLSTEIADPFGGTKADFEVCYNAIRQSCDNLLKYITNRAINDK